MRGLTVEQISILISASAEQAIAQLDQVSQKVSALAGGKPFSLILNTAQPCFITLTIN
jgi:hypothetical protein